MEMDEVETEANHGRRKVSIRYATGFRTVVHPE
jgi:hypothetical protein